MDEQVKLNLLAVIEIHNIPDVEIRDIVKIACPDLFRADLPIEKALACLVQVYGGDRTNILLGHRETILDYYDEISTLGYDLADAIQDFMDGKC